MRSIQQFRQISFAWIITSHWAQPLCKLPGRMGQNQYYDLCLLMSGECVGILHWTMSTWKIKLDEMNYNVTEEEKRLNVALLTECIHDIHKSHSLAINNNYRFDMPRRQKIICTEQLSIFSPIPLLFCWWFLWMFNKFRIETNATIMLTFNSLK